MAIEKRKYERFAPQGNAFAALGHRYTRVGPIIDISMGGLAFEYISVKDEDRDSSSIDIFLMGSVFNLHNVPCAVVYDIQNSFPIRNLESIKLSSTKRCGVQFAELTKYAIDQLKYFLERHAKNYPS